MSLMEGFPARPESQVTLANWRVAPYNVWAFQHVREIIPTAEIAPDTADVAVWPIELADTRGWRIPVAGGVLDFDRFLEASSTDAIVVAHRGRIVVERYANGMGPYSTHILMSVSKSMLALVAGILEARGLLDSARPVTDYVPELSGTGYAGATVRHLLDMSTGVKFDEDYAATSGPIVEYRRATGWNPSAAGDAATDLRSFYRCLSERDRAHGGLFHYVSPNSDLLGWVLERATGRRFAELASECLWAPMGASRSAYITVDRLGAPRCAGGMCASVRDLALVGQVIADGGKRGRRQVVPAAWIDDVLENGDSDAWDAGSFVEYYPGAKMHYRSQWYVERGPNPLMFGMGIHGQNLFVDRNRQIVIAKFSSRPIPLDADDIALTMRGVAAIRETLSRA